MKFMRLVSHLAIALFVVVVASFAATPAAAQADSLRDYFGPRELALGESMRASATGARAITLNPAGLTLNRQLVFEGSYGFRPEDGASSVAVSACDSTNALPGCYYYRYFSAEPTVGSMSLRRRAHEFGVVLSRSIGPRLSIGTTTKYFDYNTEMTGEEDSSGFAFDAGMIFRVTPSLTAGVAGYNLIAADSSQYPRAVGAGLAVRPTPNLGLTADGVWNLDVPSGQKTGRYGGGIEYFYRASSGQAGFPIRVGGVYDNSESAKWITGGIGYTNPKMGFDIGARKRVDGDDELFVIAGLRLFGGQK